MRTKLVLVVDRVLPKAQAVNAAMVTGLALGGRLPGGVAADGKDASGGLHAGLNPNPVPVLTAEAAALRGIFDDARGDDRLTVVGFNELARRSRDYAAYLDLLAATAAADIDYAAVALYGPRARVNQVTRRLPLLE